MSLLRKIEWPCRVTKGQMLFAFRMKIEGMANSTQWISKSISHNLLVDFKLEAMSFSLIYALIPLPSSTLSLFHKFNSLTK